MRVLLLTTLIFSIDAVTATATTYREQPSMVTAAGSDQEVTGSVQTLVAERHDFGSGRKILTRVTLALEAGGTVDVFVPGGTVDGITARVSGAPQFVVGERTRLTVRKTRRGLQLVGLGTGKVVVP